MKPIQLITWFTYFKTVSLSFILTIGLVLTLGNSLDAKDQVYTNSLTGNNLIVGGQLVSVDALYTGNPSWYTNIPYQQVNNFIILRIDPNSTAFIGCNYDVSVSLNITVFDKDGVSTILPASTLSIEYNNDRGAVHQDQAIYKYSDAHRVEVSITNIVTNYTSGSCSNNIVPINLRLENKIEIERYYNFNANTVVSFDGCPPPNTIVNTGCRFDATTNELVLEWNEVLEAEAYDLEWLHINNYDGNPGGNLSSTALNFDFKYNSTRIQTAQTFYRIQSIFEQGYVVFRIRAIGRGGVNFDIPIIGVWSIPDGIQNDPTQFCYFQINGIGPNAPPIHESDQINWQYIANYAEEGKHKLSVSYFDGSLRNRQVVSKINTEEQAIVGETIYDYQGRGAIQVLPTPAYTNNSSTPDPQVKYFDKYNRPITAPTRSYEQQDFDQDQQGVICAVETTPMSTIDGSSQYYSSVNPDQAEHQAFVPDAQEFPFTQIEYTPDNTGRIRRQSGVGIDHQLNSGHETKYYYGKPSQEHLDRLFGHEVGQFSHYKKNMVIDANGQISVSYLDQQGRVIATALAGDSIAGMWSLESNKQTQPDPFNVNILDNKPLLPGASILESTYSYLATSKGNHDFKYSITAEEFQPDCLGDICYECVYDVVISVKDECGIEKIPSQTTPGTFEPIRATIGPSGILDTLCPTNPVYWDESFALYLEVGLSLIHI